MDCPICTWSSDNADYPFLYQTNSWRVCLAPNQSLVGRCVIHLKRHAGDLADLTRDEGLEFWEVVKQVEAAVRSAFDATLFNWSCYMNHSFRDAAPNPHIHWWAVPRYNHPVEIGGLVFVDPQFGSPYDHSRWLDVSAEVRSQIVERIRKALP